MSKHTPAPWVFGRMPDDSVKMILGGADRRYVATVQIHQSPRYMGSYAEAEREANARLIAAAPELLEALTKLVAESVHPYDGGEFENGEWAALDAARAAIAKATGEQA